MLATLANLLNIRRVGGLIHFRVGRFGGSVYFKRRRSAPRVGHRAIRETSAAPAVAAIPAGEILPYAPGSVILPAPVLAAQPARGFRVRINRVPGLPRLDGATGWADPLGPTLHKVTFDRPPFVGDDCRILYLDRQWLAAIDAAGEPVAVADECVAAVADAITPRDPLARWAESIVAAGRA